MPTPSNLFRRGAINVPILGEPCKGGSLMSRKDEKLKREAPYKTTTVPWERTKGQIEKLLNDYGVEGTQWTNYKGHEDLKFIVKTEVRGIQREIMIEVKPPQMFIRKRVTHQGMVKTENKNQAYRLLYYWIKSKLEAVIWGLSTIENEFLSHVTIALPDGSTTVGEIMSGYIAEDKLKALPPPSPVDEKEPKVIEAEVIEL